MTSIMLMLGLCVAFVLMLLSQLHNPQYTQTSAQSFMSSGWQGSDTPVYNMSTANQTLAVALGGKA